MPGRAAHLVGIGDRPKRLLLKVGRAPVDEHTRCKADIEEAGRVAIEPPLPQARRRRDAILKRVVRLMAGCAGPSSVSRQSDVVERSRPKATFSGVMGLSIGMAITGRANGGALPCIPVQP